MGSRISFGMNFRHLKIVTILDIPYPGDSLCATSQVSFCCRWWGCVVAVTFLLILGLVVGGMGVFAISRSRIWPATSRYASLHGAAYEIGDRQQRPHRPTSTTRPSCRAHGPSSEQAQVFRHLNQDNKTYTGSSTATTTGQHRHGQAPALLDAGLLGRQHLLTRTKPSTSFEPRNADAPQAVSAATWPRRVVVASLIAVVGIMAIVVDGGLLLDNRRKLQARPTRPWRIACGIFGNDSGHGQRFKRLRPPAASLMMGRRPSR